jgi:hypothetical protein
MRRVEKNDALEAPASLAPTTLAQHSGDTTQWSRRVRIIIDQRDGVWEEDVALTPSRGTG